MLTVDQTVEKIREPAGRAFLQAGISIQNKHKIHVTGDGYEDKLKQLVGFESKGDYDVRKQLTSPATVQLCAIILDNLNRWATNQGTVKTIKFKQDAQEVKFRDVLSQVWRGKSLENFINTFYKEAIYQEMMGFLVITKPILITGTEGGVSGIKIREGIEMPYNGDALDPYIIFINAESVLDFNSVGDHLEYLIIDLGDYEQDKKTYHTYRVLDDKQDTIIVWDGEKIINSRESLHGVGYTPAIQVSNISKHLTDDKVKTSPIDHVIPALDRYMQKDSDLIIQMVRHMYPKLASVTTLCKQCSGEGYYYDKETKIKCKDCNGTGKVIPISREGVIGMPQYIDEGKTPYPGSPASYITPDNASLQIAIDDLKELGKDILYSATGDKNLIVEGLETATENMINFKGLEDRIAEIIKMVESREEFIISTVAKMHIDFKNALEDVSVRYGRRLTLRGENEIMSEIKSAKDAGMPISHIEALQRELIYTRYKNNPTELERQLILSDLEPFNGYTVKEILDFKEFTDPMDINLKFNFNKLIDWFESTKGLLTQYEGGTEWSKRIENIYKILKDEVLRISGESGPDRGQILDPPIEERTDSKGTNT